MHIQIDLRSEHFNSFLPFKIYHKLTAAVIHVRLYYCYNPMKNNPICLAALAWYIHIIFSVSKQTEKARKIFYKIELLHCFHHDID